MNVCQTKIPACISKGKSFMIDTKQMQDCGMEVVNMHLVFDHRRANFVGVAVTNATLNSGSGHP